MPRLWLAGQPQGPSGSVHNVDRRFCAPITHLACMNSCVQNDQFCTQPNFAD